MTEIHTDVVKVAVSLLPLDHDASSYYTVMVEYRGPGRWAVTRHGNCLSRSGEWDYESMPSSRTDDWLAEFRFTYDEAIEAAAKVAPTLKVNGMSVQEVLEGKWR